MKVVAVFLLHTKLIWHQRYSQLWPHVIWQIRTDISEYLLPPSSGWWRWQVPLGQCYISTGLQWLDQGDKQHYHHHLENLRSQFIWHSTSPWNLSQNLIDKWLYIQIYNCCMCEEFDCQGVCEQVRRCHCLLVVEIWASHCSDMFALLGCDTLQFDRCVRSVTGHKETKLKLN